MKKFDQSAECDKQTNAVAASVESACKRIAPTWPLDQFIAVNPYWGFLSDPLRTVAERIESYSGSRMAMPRAFYRTQWNAGSLRAEHLQEALERSELRISMTELLLHLEGESPIAPRIPLFTSIADSKRDLLHGMSISDFVTHNVSQHCASYFDHCQSSWGTQRKSSLYQSWLQHAQTDRSPWLLMGIHKWRHYANSLPDEPLALINAALQLLPVPPEERTDYLTALLMSLNGWASWCAYERWQANLVQKDDDQIVQLLAIRLAWEQFAFELLLNSEAPPSWSTGWKMVRDLWKNSDAHMSVDWIFQEAIEISYQSQLCLSLKSDLSGSDVEPPTTPDVQAVFCIDVRAEVFRRALEGCSDSVQTLGFAGFFGLPISYSPLGTSGQRPQLPGLLAPKLCVTDTTGSEETDQLSIRKRRRSLGLTSVWKDFRSSSTSTFTFVESFGLFYAGSLLKRTVNKRNPKTEAGFTGHEGHSSPRLCFTHQDGGDAPAVESLVELVAGILRNMSLTSGFARIVLLTGHGSQTANNPHAAGLDCGACGGQTGEVNARVLAGLLNDPTIRFGLRTLGIEIPDTTHVLPAVHNTTTDEITILDAALLPKNHESDLSRLVDWLQQAGHRARTERAEGLGLESDAAGSPATLLDRFQIRSRDWSQVRPEWGLANNAAFLIAPRTRSRGIDLEGRVFLHEYQSGNDPNGTVLEAIMTAPMLVTNWINMQYYASTVDNRLYGSGNKVLHNVVGGRIGVFEGNGGDLRIGLPLQSLHDGHNLRHIPLRLSVFIEAPQGSIGAIIQKHKVVRDLIHNQWIHLFQITPESHTFARYRDGIWERIERHNFHATKEQAVFTREAYA
ncbi:YbcC family protein [soil metagenome]